MIRRVRLTLGALILLTGLAAGSASPVRATSSPTSPDGLVWLDPWAPYTLRASAAFAQTSLSAETAVEGFAGMGQILFMLDVTSITLTGGSTPTAALTVYVQRSPDGGTTWDDLLAFKTAALSNGGAEVIHVAEYNKYLVTPPTPAVVQDGGGSPAFSQRGGWISNKLRVKSKLDLTGTPTAYSVTFAVTAKGRP